MPLPTKLPATLLIGCAIALTIGRTTALEPAGREATHPPIFASNAGSTTSAGTTTAASTTADARSEWRFAGQLGGGVGDVAMLDHYALLGVGPRLAVFDLAVPEKPRWVATGPLLGGTVRGIAVQDGRVYVAAEGGGLYVLDGADPQSLTLLGSVNLSQGGPPDDPDQGVDVQVQGGYAYVAVEGVGLSMVDVRDPARPVPVGAVGNPGAGTMRLAVSGSTVLLASDRGWLDGPAIVAIDVRDPARPVLAGQVPSCTPGDIARMAGYTLVACLGGELEVLDLADPAQPAFIASLDLDSSPRSMAVDGLTAYVGDDAGSVYVVDLADAAAPRVVTRVGEPQTKSAAVIAIGVRGGMVCAAILADLLHSEQPWVGLGAGGLKVIDASAPASARVAARIRVPSGVLRAIEPGAGAGEVWVIDTPGGGTDDFQASEIPIDARNAVYLIDAADPSRPRVRAGFQLPGEALPVGLTLAAPYLYVLAQVPDFGSRLYVVDTRDLDVVEARALDAPRIRVVPGFEGPVIRGPRVVDGSVGSPVKMDVVANTLVVMTLSTEGSEATFDWLDLSNPAEPRPPERFHPFRGPLVVHDAVVLMASDPLAYLLHDEGRLSILDFRDPLTPRLAAAPGFDERPSRGAVVGQTLLAMDWAGELRLWDASRWAKLDQVGRIRVDATEFAMLGAHADRAFVLDEGGKLSVVDIALPSEPALGQIVDPPAIAPSTDERQHTIRPLPLGLAVTAGRVYGSIADRGLIIHTEAPRADPPVNARGRAYLPLTMREHQRPPTVHPRKLEQVGTWLAPGDHIGLLDVAGDDQYAYVIGRDVCGGALHVIDVSQPWEPAEVGRIDLSFAPLAVQVVDGRAHVVGDPCGGSGGFAVIDVGDAHRPRLMAHLDLPRLAIAVAVQGRWAYVLDGSYDLMPGPGPRLNRHVAAPAAAPRSAASPRRVEQRPVDEGLFLRIIDLADPMAPRQVQRFKLSDETTAFPGMAVANGHALVADVYGGLRVVDVNNPAAPREIALFPAPGAFDVAVSGGRVFVIGRTGELERDPVGLWIVDIGNPARPAQLGALVEIARPGGNGLGSSHLAVADGVAYVGSGRRLRAIDVRDPAWPVVLDDVETPGFGVAAAGRRVYAVTDVGLNVYELVDR